MRCYASTALNDDREIVLEAVKQNGVPCNASTMKDDPRSCWRPSSRRNALDYASVALQNDREFVEAANVGMRSRQGDGGTARA